MQEKKLQLRNVTREREVRGNFFIIEEKIKKQLFLPSFLIENFGCGVQCVDMCLIHTKIDKFVSKLD